MQSARNPWCINETKTQPVAVQSEIFARVPGAAKGLQRVCPRGRGVAGRPATLAVAVERRTDEKNSGPLSVYTVVNN